MGMNTEKFTKTEVMDRGETFMAQLLPGFMDSRVVGSETFLVTSKPNYFKCNTCIQEALFTLDNAKFWYLTFYYQFLSRVYDVNRLHFIEGDTDSMYFAVAGDPKKDYKQGLEDLIIDREYYDENYKYWYPSPKTGDRLKDARSEKQLLGLSVENQGTEMIALSPKCYTLKALKKDLINPTEDDKDIIKTKMKGVSARQNNFNVNDYHKALLKPLTGSNYGMVIDRNTKNIVYHTVNKTALSGVHTKIFVLPNESCAPYGFDAYGCYQQSVKNVRTAVMNRLMEDNQSEALTPMRK